MAWLARDPEVEALIDAYRTDLIAAGHFAENEVTSPARAFLLRVGGAAGWTRLSVAEQRQICEPRESAIVMWMIAAVISARGRSSWRAAISGSARCRRGCIASCTSGS